MNQLLSIAGRRFFLKHPWQLVLAITGIALGVAVYVGVDLANDSARRAFSLTADLITGGTTHHLMGTNGDIPNALYREIRVEHGPFLAAPIIEDDVRLARLPRRRLAIMGIDPLEETGFRGFAGFVPGRDADLNRLLVEPGSVLVPEALAEELELDTGSSLGLLIGDIERTVQVAGTVRETTADGAGASVPIVTDIASAQELLGVTALSRIDLILTDDDIARLESLGLEGVTLIPASGRNAAFNELARAFRVNLTALSLLALMVGVFLIYATMSFAIVQRRKTFGVLRAIGVSRAQLLRSVLLEALVIGALATALGLILGNLLASNLVDLVLRTVGDLYFRSSVAAVSPSALLYWKGLALGLGTTLLAAAAPALEAAATPPHAAMSRAALERSAQAVSRRAAWLAVPAAVAAVALLMLSPRSLIVAFAGLFFIISAGALLIPFGTYLLARLVEPLAEAGFGITGSLAARGVSASLSRTGVATAALSVAVATVVGIGLMIGSFRTSVEAWLDDTLTADVYVSTERSNVIDEEILAQLGELEGVAGTSVSRVVQLPTWDGELSLRAFDPGPRGWGLTITSPDPDEAIARLEAGDGVFVSEPFAFRRNLASGDELALPTAMGEEPFRVLGIFRDYNTNAGTVLIPMASYREHWLDQSVSGLGISLQDSDRRRATVAEIQALFAGEPGVRFRSNEFIRERSLTVFDRTFRITEVLRMLAGVVAFLGLASALLSIELEKAREVAILRALGLGPRQIRVLTLTQTGLLGIAAGLLAIPLGIIMAALLVFVINERSFGWSMSLVIAPSPLLLGIALAVSAALLAGIYPAMRAARSTVAAQLREE